MCPSGQDTACPGGTFRSLIELSEKDVKSKSRFLRDGPERLRTGPRLPVRSCKVNIYYDETDKDTAVGELVSPGSGAGAGRDADLPARRPGGFMPGAAGEGREDLGGDKGRVPGVDPEAMGRDQDGREKDAHRAPAQELAHVSKM